MNAFPKKRLKPWKISKIYKAHCIRKKKICIAKPSSMRIRRKIRREVPRVREELQHYINRGFRILYLDETMITKSTVPN